MPGKIFFHFLTFMEKNDCSLLSNVFSISAQVKVPAALVTHVALW